LDALAKNEGLLSARGWSAKRRQIEALPLSGWYAERRKDLLGLLDELNQRIAPLDEAVNLVSCENISGLEPGIRA
jgi:hypothetical protein